MMPKLKKKKPIKKTPIRKKKKVVKTKRAPKKIVRRTTKKIKKSSALELKRHIHNPVIEPESHRYWESKAAFNPSAVYHDGKIHVIYRAIGDSDISVLGYAESPDGFSFDRNSKELAYYSKKKPVDRRAPRIDYISGGGWGGGCEDPRLTLLDDKIYMIYTSFDGWGFLRLALTSISLDDFISRRFHWKEPVLISPPGEIHKNWVIFPEKIKGPATGGASKYAILHSISPHILVDYFDSMDELDGTRFIHSVHQGSPLWQERDKLTRGVGPSPIKTKYGWLVFYHKMEKHDPHRYKLWAMILDAKDPTKVLYNTSQPVLEPDLWYENEGYKSGVIYSCGAVVKNGKLFVYYGGADRVTCVATADLDKFLRELANSKAPNLRGGKTKTKR